VKLGGTGCRANDAQQAGEPYPDPSVAPCGPLFGGLATIAAAFVEPTQGMKVRLCDSRSCTYTLAGPSRCGESYIAVTGALRDLSGLPITSDENVLRIATNT
jgi:hypothetical protein